MTIGQTGIAILGAGIFATEAYIPALKALGDAAPLVRAIYSRSEQSARTLSDAAGAALNMPESPEVYHDADSSKNLEVLLARSDIGAVVVVLPITHQPQVIIKALEAGKHVLSEKPVAADVQVGLELIETYRTRFESKGLTWRVAENFEAEPIFQAARDAISQGKIGTIKFFKATVTNYINQSSKWYKTPWRTVPDYQGGFILDGGVHTIAALRTMLPRPLTHLSGFASLTKDYLKPHDTIHVIAKAGDHFHGLVDMTWAWPTKSTPDTDDFVITGTEGYLTIRRVSSGISRMTIKKGTSADKEAEEVSEFESKGIQEELKSFLDKISGKEGARELGRPEGALSDVAFIQAALTSQGNLVAL